jgi:molecular chaperone DnaK
VDETGIVPSVVSEDDQGIVVGRRALNRAVAFPERSCRSVKRLMGADRKISLGSRDLRPEEVSSLILGYLISEAKRLEGREVRRAVITVPAYFSDAQRRATREAGLLAGLEVERLINEPTAAALFYDLVNVGGEAPPGGWRHTLVYDLGGGTFDVSVLRLGEIIEVVASTGDTRLGGDDFDALIARRLVETIRDDGGPDVTGYPPAMARLLAAAEKAKISLSELGTVRIDELAIPADRDGRMAGVSVELTRTDLEELTRPLVERTIDLVGDALKESRLAAKDIDRVVLVGGMTRMPAITEAIAKIFGSAQLPAVDPDLSVSHGAAVQGGIITGENAEQILVDVAAHTLSLEVLGRSQRLECSSIIPRNTSIPAKRSRVFYSCVDQQRMVELNIYQGESLLPEGNELIGRKALHLAPAEVNSPIEVEYSYDLNGIIHVVAEHRGYGRKVELDIDSRAPEARVHESLFDEDEDDDDEEADLIFAGPDDDEEDEGDIDEAPSDRRPGVNLVIRRAESILASRPDGPGRLELGQALERYREALTGDDEALVDRLEDDLMSLIDGGV